MAGAIYFTLMNSFMQNLASCIYIFQVERPIFLREHASKMYDLEPYFFSKILVDLPIQIIIPLLVCLMSYWAYGLTATPHQFFIFYVVNFLVAFVGSSIGYFISSAFSRLESALAMMPLFMLPITLFGGFISTVSTIPSWINWL